MKLATYNKQIVLVGGPRDGKVVLFDSHPERWYINEGTYKRSADLPAGPVRYYWEGK